MDPDSNQPTGGRGRMTITVMLCDKEDAFAQLDAVRAELAKVREERETFRLALVVQAQDSARELAKVTAELADARVDVGAATAQFDAVTKERDTLLAMSTNIAACNHERRCPYCLDIVNAALAKVSR